MSDYLEDFFSYLEYEKRYSAHTVTAYRKDLSQFMDFILEQKSIFNPVDITKKDVRSWMATLMQMQYSPRTVGRKVSALSKYFHYLMLQSVLNLNPVKNLVKPKTNKRLPQFVKEKELDFLFDSFEFSNDFEGVRDKLILLLFYTTGIRLSELVGLKLSSINLGNHTLKVLGKRNKERIIPILTELEGAFMDYLMLREENFGKSTDKMLFLTIKGENIYHKLVYRIVNHYLNMVASSEKKSPHVLRHSFATSMLNKGADLNAIKEILGHVNLSATEIYTHSSFAQLKSIYNKTHPRS